MSVAGRWGHLSQAERDAAYNNSAAVADSARLNTAREAASVTFRTRHAAHLDLPYGDKGRNVWDLFPQPDPTAPCVVFIHGGYWQRNSRDQFAGVIAGAHVRGWAAALPGYTLAPDASLTQIVAELNAALDWLAVEGPTHGINGPVLLSGWSAGGHLTAMCLGHPLVRAGLAISGVFELGPVRDTYLNEKLRLTDEEVAALSPRRLAGVDKPLAFAFGTAELPALMADSRGFHERRSVAHLPGVLIPVAKADHFTILHELVNGDGLLTRHLPLVLD